MAETTAEPARPDQPSLSSRFVARRSMSVAFYLFALILVILIPALATALVLLHRTNDAQEEVVHALINATVQAMGQSVEREITGMSTTLRVLSSSELLLEGNLVEFHQRARVALSGTGGYLIGVDDAGNQLLNTRVPYGAPLNSTSDIKTMNRAVERGAATISGLFFGKTAQTYVFNVWQPVSDAAPIALLALTQNAQNLVPVLQSQQLPQGWNAALVDRKNAVIAANVGSGLDIGTSLQMRLNPDGSGEDWLNETFNGEPVFTAEWRSSLTGWRVIAWAPTSKVQKPLDDSILRLAATGFAIALVAAGIAVVIAQRIGISVQGLRRDAQRLGRGELIAASAYPVAEIAEISHALADASLELQTVERDNHFLMRELAHRSKNQMAVIAAMAKQTARGAEDIHLYVEALERRIMGLARSTDLLLANGRAGISLQSLVDLQLTPFLPNEPDRLVVEGPDIRINPQAAQLLGMALHELGTNALRHGAFADEKGRVELKWQVDKSKLNMHWCEHLSAPLTQSDRAGFGTTVLRAMVAGVLNADVERVDEESGVAWTFDIPLASLDPAFSAHRPDEGRVPE